MNEVRKTVRAQAAELKRAAGEAKQSKRNRATLREASRLLTESVKNLTKIIDQHDALLALSPDLPPDAKAQLAGFGPFVTNGDVDLSSLLYAVSAISNLASDGELAEKLKQMTVPTTEAKRKKLAIQDEVIWKHADQYRIDHRDSSRWEIACAIQNPVSEELRARDRLKWHTLSPRTIIRSLDREPS
jgi:hypothetical protein